jgi:endo-chitodextinase
MNEITESFSGSANDILIQGITIKNYTENGMHFNRGANLTLKRVTFKDSGGETGEMKGAVRLNNISNIKIQHSDFIRVTAGILSTDCEGPVLIEWNTAINVGRNFIQLDKCKGSDIKIRFNTMERQGDYLRGAAHDVVDWISIYKSEGTPESPILVKNNRARGHGHDKTGSFIMLGDGGGKYQYATGNVGVNPGQVGIGIAGGEDIVVRENMMFSVEWKYSNVAFYSADYSTPYPCSNHEITENRAYWIKGGMRRQNNLWTDNNCNPMIKNNFFPDFSINENIWYHSAAASMEN